MSLARESDAGEAGLRIDRLPGRSDPRPAPEPHPLYHVSKRAMDVLVSLALILISSPLILVTAMALSVELRSSPFFVQQRIGYLGRPFPILKLRTMRASIDETAGAGQAETDGPAFKDRFDPRITRVGRIVRRTSIDELPQFINVLLGQMSLVGPRPRLPAEALSESPDQAARLTVKPGMTCIWQTSGRSTLPLNVWIRMDNDYVIRRSLWLDLQLLMKTPGAVITMRGAW